MYYFLKSETLKNTVIIYVIEKQSLEQKWNTSFIKNPSTLGHSRLNSRLSLKSK